MAVRRPGRRSEARLPVRRVGRRYGGSASGTTGRPAVRRVGQRNDGSAGGTASGFSGPAGGFSWVGGSAARYVWRILRTTVGRPGTSGGFSPDGPVRLADSQADGRTARYVWRILRPAGGRGRAGRREAAAGCRKLRSGSRTGGRARVLADDTPDHLEQLAYWRESSRTAGRGGGLLAEPEDCQERPRTARRGRGPIGETSYRWTRSRPGRHRTAPCASQATMSRGASAARRGRRAAAGVGGAERGRLVGGTAYWSLRRAPAGVTVMSPQSPPPVRLTIWLAAL